MTTAKLQSKMISMDEKFLTLKEVAKKLRVSERSIYRYIGLGKIKATKIGYWRINEKDVAKLVSTNSNLKNRGK